MRDENPSQAANTEKRKKIRAEEIVLTRTSRGGLVQPLPDSEHERPDTGRKRRKQKKVTALSSVFVFFNINTSQFTVHSLFCENN